MADVRNRTNKMNERNELYGMVEKMELMEA